MLDWVAVSWQTSVSWQEGATDGDPDAQGAELDAGAAELGAEPGVTRGDGTEDRLRDTARTLAAILQLTRRCHWWMSTSTLC